MAMRTARVPPTLNMVPGSWVCFYRPIARNFLAFLATWKIQHLVKLQKCQTKTKDYITVDYYESFSNLSRLHLKLHGTVVINDIETAAFRRLVALESVKYCRLTSCCLLLCETWPSRRMGSSSDCLGAINSCILGTHCCCSHGEM